MRFELRPTALLALLAAIISWSVASPAAAFVGMNLLWDDCYQGGGRFVNNDGCDASRTLIVSIETDQMLDQINGAQGYIEVSFDGGDIPDYWRVDMEGCRAGNLVADGTVGSASPPFSCAEPWSQSGGQVAAVRFFPYYGCNNKARIVWLIAVPNGTVQMDPTVASEWYVMKLTFAGGQTSCGGCSLGACFLAYETRLTRPVSVPGGDYFIYQWATSGDATWGNPSFLCYASDGGGPPCPTPTRNSTWGQIKSMYR